MSTWLIIAAMAAVTYATRALPLLARWRPPHPLAERALRHVPPAILAALVLPALLAPGGSPEAGPELWAGLVGAVVAWRTANMPLTIFAGLGAFAFLR
jgi:branched-subunit amino acid transport protein